MFKVGDYVQHKHDPDVHGAVVAVSEDKTSFTVQLPDGKERADLGFWILQKANLLEAIARAANMNFRGPGA